MNNGPVSSEPHPVTTNDGLDDKEEGTDRVENQTIVETNNATTMEDSTSIKTSSKEVTNLHPPPLLPSITATFLTSSEPHIPSSKSRYSRNDIDLFPQGCNFSPDGLCVLTSQCHRLLLYNTPSEALKYLSTSASATPTTSTSDQHRETPVASPWKQVLDIETGDKVRSYEWYPHMNSSNPASCCFVAASRDQPVHLYDAYNGTVRATYRPYNRLDEMESPNVVTFCENGQHLVTGGFNTDRMIQIFDLNKPGRDALHVVKLGKTRKSKDGQKGLISAIASGSRFTTTTSTGTPYHNLLAIGTYSPGSIYLYDTRCYKAGDVSTIKTAQTVSGTCVVGHGKSHRRKRKHFRLEDKDSSNILDSAEAGNGDGGDEDDDILFNFSAAKIKWYQSRSRGGVTQIQFSPIDHLLYSASRRSNAILAWDIRKLSSLERSPLSAHCPGIASYKTDNDTNQRLDFTFCQQNDKQQIWIGGRDNCVRVYDCQSQRLIITIGIAFSDSQGNDGDAINGVSIFKSSENQSRALMAVSVGSRKFPTEQDYWTSEDDDDDMQVATSSVTTSPTTWGLQMYEICSGPNLRIRR